MTNLIPTLRLSLEMTNVLAHIEQNGIKINSTTLAEIREEYEQVLFQLERRLNELAANAMGDTPVNLDSPDDRSMLMYSCKVVDKKRWAVLFNLGHEMRGATRKPKMRKRMSRAEFKGYVLRETDVVYKTVGSQCQDCGGKGRYNPLRKDGSIGKAVRICKTCDGKGVVYTNTSEVAGFKMVPRDAFDVAAGGFKTDKETLEEVYSLNSKYNKIAEADMNVARNVHWKIKTLKWDNLFNYGEGNQINFEKLGGTIGIFGKNFSGKSSIIDALLFTIFNTTSKNIRKNYNIINQNKDTAFGEVEIEIGDKTYKIRRESEKYTKKLKGKETNEARTQVDFSYRDNLTGETHSLNKTERGATDKAIKSVLGDYEDFLYTTMSSQSGAMVFINEGSTKRKEILAKFLDLEFFEKKFRLAKEDASDLRGQLKRFTDRDFDSEIGDLNKSLFS